MGITHLASLEVAGVPTMGIAGLPPSTGNYWFVNSVTGSDGNSGTADFPFATINHAILAATADNGDIIVCTAGHAENLSGAGSITINKSGITLWGIGAGADRPTLTVPTGSATSTTFLVTSANFLMGGAFVLVNAKASLVTFLSIQAADCSITAECHDNAVGTAALIWASAGGTTTATRMVLNLTVYGFSNASPVPTALVSLTGPSINSNITINCYGKWSVAIVNFVGTAVINCDISGTFVNASNTAGSAALDVVDTITGSTWTVQGFDANVGALQGSNAAAVATVGSGGAKTAQSTVTGVLTTGTTIFTIAGGPIELLYIMSMCTTGGDATAATLLYTTQATGLTAVPISTACASIANAGANATITYAGTGSAAACVYNANGNALLASTVAGSAVILAPGTIKITIGSGPTVTGTWSHFISYRPLGPSATVS